MHSYSSFLLNRCKGGSAHTLLLITPRLVAACLTLRIGSKILLRDATMLALDELIWNRSTPIMRLSVTGGSASGRSTPEDWRYCPAAPLNVKGCG
jgi:hypothetical protein